MCLILIIVRTQSLETIKFDLMDVDWESMNALRAHFVFNCAKNFEAV